MGLKDMGVKRGLPAREERPFRPQGIPGVHRGVTRPPSRLLVDSLNDAEKIERFFEMGKTDTFMMPKLRAWVLERCNGRILNVYGGKTRLQKPGCTFVHNDIDSTIDADYHCDARELDRHFAARSFDTVILDPPYTVNQAVHYYNGRKCRDITPSIEACDRLLKAGGTAITLGYNTTGFSEKRGFQKLAILMVNLGSRHNDILVTVERKCGEPMEARRVHSKAP